MYVSSYYRGEKMVVHVYMPDLVAVDWEARLFSKLSGWGYETLHKPHPSSVALPYPGFTSEFGVKVLAEPFERVLDNADAFIFTSSHTTTLKSAIASDKPLIYVDFGTDTWVPEVYAMFARRCRIVKGWFDEANRAQVDWDDLRAAIEESRYQMDSSFYDNYLEGMIAGGEGGC